MRKYKKISGLLASKDRWCQQVYAVDKDNNAVPPTSDEANRFCIAGAAKRIYGAYTEQYYKALTKLTGQPDENLVTHAAAVFNDTSTHQCVLAACKKAKI